MPAAAPTSTTLSTKGQVILPKAIRDQRHWTPGTRLVVEDTPAGVLLKAAPIFPPTTHEQVFGSVPHDGRARSLEEMEAAIPAEVKRRHALGRY